MVREIGERLIRVAISPPLPKEIVRECVPVGTLLLGQVDGRLRMSDIGHLPFMVDIYFQRTGSSDECMASDLERIGCGLLHSTLEDALLTSPIGDLK